MNDLDVKLAAAFVAPRAVLTPAELRWGYEHGLLASEELIRLVTEYLARGISLSPSEMDLAALLADDVAEVPTLAKRLERGSASDAELRRVWAYLLADCVYQNRSRLRDPHHVLEQLYADLDYPEEWRSLIRWMPAEPGQQRGMAALDERWRAYVSAESEHYKSRRR